MILMTIFFFLGSILNWSWSGFYINVITKFGFLLFQVLFIPIPADSLYITVISLFHQNMKLCSAWTLPEINLLLKCFYTDPQHYYLYDVKFSI